LLYEFIYLASKSPRRQILLQQLGIAFELLLAQEDEDSEKLEVVLAGESAISYVQRVTKLKFDAAVHRVKNQNLPVVPVLCSDTTVAFGDRILGKPSSTQEAKEMLYFLSGKTHKVLTSVAVGTSVKMIQILSVSEVTFVTLSAQQINDYVASLEPFGKSGSYGIQGKAAAFISHISGSYSGIMGLPLYETAELLKEFEFKI